MKRDETYKEFVDRIHKKGSKPYKIQHCLGSKDAWKWIRKNKWKTLGGKSIDALLYGKIVTLVNKQLVEEILDGRKVEFPHRMGEICLEKVPTWVSVGKDGKIKSNYRTDWKKTLHLWHEDMEARKAHNPVKKISNCRYRLHYFKDTALFKNRTLYLFNFNRSFTKRLSSLEDTGKINVMISENTRLW